MGAGTSWFCLFYCDSIVLTCYFVMAQTSPHSFFAEQQFIKFKDYVDSQWNIQYEIAYDEYTF